MMQGLFEYIVLYEEFPDELEKAIGKLVPEGWQVDKIAAESGFYSAVAAHGNHHTEGGLWVILKRIKAIAAEEAA